MGNINGWGQAAINNLIGWGKGRFSAVKISDWGIMYDSSYAGQTNITGIQGKPLPPPKEVRK